MCKDSYTKVIYEVVYKIMLVLLSVVFMIALYFGFRIYIGDWFRIPTNSMSPTLIPGDQVIVNKLIAGARIYDEFDFRDGAPLCSHRTKGLRHVERNDIVIFNCPLNRERTKLQFEINYVFGKRCIAIPGDTISIYDGYFYNNNFNGYLGVKSLQDKLSRKPNNEIPNEVLRAIPFDDTNYQWTIKNFGPLYVPKKGGRILVDSISYKPYQLAIEFETSKKISVLQDGCVMLGDSAITDYTFTKNYYFMCGDNVIDSNDSRYWGVVPEEFIIGVVSHIIKSRDRQNDIFIWNRFFKSVLKTDDEEYVVKTGR